MLFQGLLFSCHTQWASSDSQEEAVKKQPIWRLYLSSEIMRLQTFLQGISNCQFRPAPPTPPGAPLTARCHPGKPQPLPADPDARFAFLGLQSLRDTLVHVRPSSSVPESPLTTGACGLEDATRAHWGLRGIAWREARDRCAQGVCLLTCCRFLGQTWR